MKLVQYRTSSGGPSAAGILDGDAVLAAANLLAQLGHDPEGGSSVLRFIQLPRDTQAAVAAAGREPGAREAHGRPLATVELLAPIARPGKVIGLGYNYRQLCTNEGVTPGAEPELFTKMPTSITGPHDPVIVPDVITKVDFEAELGVVMGRVCRNVSAADALSFVAGYTVIDDVTAKIIPRPPEAGSVVLALKGVDTFAPIGPCLVTTDEIPDPQDLRILCRVNGEQRQDFHSSDMVHSVAEVIAYISQRITLEPGDILTTGTGLGIGIVQRPPVFLRDNDVVECEIEGIGTIRNTFVLLAERQPAGASGRA